MSKVNVFSIILIYDVISYTLTINKNILNLEYILSVLYENNYKILVILKLLLSYEIMHLKRKKLSWYLYEKKMTDNKYFFRFMNLKILFMT